MPDPIDGSIKELIVVDRETIRDQILTEAATEIEGANTAPLSDIGIKAHVVAAPIEELRLAIWFALLNAFTPYATEEALTWKGMMYDIPRKEATKALTTQVFSKPQAENYDREIPAYQQVMYGDKLFQTTATGVIPAGSLSSASVPTESVGEGSDYNLSPGAVGQIIDPSVGVVSVITDAIVLDAQDLEPLEDFRARIEEWERNRERGGDDEDYAFWGKEVAGVRDAKAYSEHRGLGTVDVVIRSYDNGGVPTQGILDAVFAYIVGTPVEGTSPLQYTGGVRPVGGDVQVWPAVTHVVNITAQVTPKEGYVLADIQPDIETLSAALLDALHFADKAKVAEIANILHDHPKVDNFVLTAPAADYQLQFAEIAVLGVVNLT